MRYMNARTAETHYYIRQVDIEGMDRVRIGQEHISYAGREFVPDRIWCKWDHGQPPERFNVSGLLVRKDGTVGKNRAAVEYGGRWGAEPPPWLLGPFADVMGGGGSGE